MTTPPGRIRVSDLPRAAQQRVRQGEPVLVESRGRAVARIVPSEEPADGLFAFEGRWKARGRLGPEEIDEAVGMAIDDTVAR